MKHLLTIFTFCLCHLVSAQKVDSLTLVIDQVEISSIKSPSEIRSYFNDISNLTRSIKKTVTNVITEFGFRSPQHDSILLVEESINESLLLKMREYLSLHPYPKRRSGDTIRNEETNDILLVELDAIGSSTAIKIFVNAADTPENLDLKKLYFPKFYPAYKTGDIYSGHLWHLLYGMYRQEMGEEYVELELGEDEQIEKMIDALQLDRKSPN